MLPGRFCLIKVMAFSVVMYGCESWTIKKAEHWRIDAFELWCYRRLLRVPWTARRSNQSILKEISPGCSLERLMLKLKCQYFGYLMWRTDPLEKTLMLGKTEGRRRRTTEDEMVGWHHRLDGHEFEQALGDSDGQGGLACCSPWVTKSQTRLSNWTELNGNWNGSENFDMMVSTLYLKRHSLSLIIPKPPEYIHLKEMNLGKLYFGVWYFLRKTFETAWASQVAQR